MGAFLMDEHKFTWGGALRVVFDSISQSPARLAEFYIDRDRTLIYRWMRDEAAPTSKLLPDIIRFVMENSINAERISIKIKMDAYINTSTLGEQVKSVLTGEDDFEKYISAVLRIALVERKKKQSASPAPRLALSLVTIVFALLASLVGGLIWNILNHMFDWSFYMGGSGNEPEGVLAFVWGLTAGVPIIVFALLSLLTAKSSSAVFARCDWRLAAVLYSLVAGAAGFIFYNSGLRGFVEGSGYSYGLQETIIVIAYATILSVLPLLSILALLRFPKTARGLLLLTVFIAPVLVSVLSVLGTALVNLPETEVAQLRGFLVGILLRLAMFAAVRTILTEQPKDIDLKTLIKK